MSDGKDGPIGECLSDSALDDRVRLYVDGCSCLVHYNDLVIGEEGSSQTNQLSLSNTANSKRAISTNKRLPYYTVISSFHPYLTFREFANLRQQIHSKLLGKFTEPT